MFKIPNLQNNIATCKIGVCFLREVNFDKCREHSTNRGVFCKTKPISKKSSQIKCITNKELSQKWAIGHLVKTNPNKANFLIWYIMRIFIVFYRMFDYGRISENDRYLWKSCKLYNNSYRPGRRCALCLFQKGETSFDNSQTRFEYKSCHSKRSDSKHREEVLRI